VQPGLRHDPHAGDLYVVRGKRGGMLKILWHATPSDGTAAVTAVQLGYMLEGSNRSA